MQLRRQLADLVEKDRAVIGQLEETNLPFLGVGVRALFVSEQFGIEERRREAGAVDFDERTTGPGRKIVDHARDPPLPRPALAGKQHGRPLARRQQLDLTRQILHRARNSQRADALGLVVQSPEARVLP